MKFITDTHSSERNLYDAALALVTARSEDILTGTIRDIDRYDPTRSSEATQEMEVIKCGQTTGVTEGTVDSTHMLTEVDYSPKAAPRMASFDEVFVVRGKDGSTFAAQGDSGSIILENRLVIPWGCSSRPIRRAGASRATLGNCARLERTTSLSELCAEALEARVLASPSESA